MRTSVLMPGGSWYSPHNYARGASRLIDFPYYRDFDFGFRLVVVLRSPY